MKTWFLNSLKLTIAIAVIFYLISKSQINLKLISSLSVSYTHLFIILSLYLCVIALSALRWKLLNSTIGVNLSYQDTLLPTYIGIAFNNLLPGGVSGDLYRYLFLNKNQLFHRATIMTSIFVDRLTGLLGIFFLLTILSIPNISLVWNITIIKYITIASFILTAGTIVSIYFGESILTLFVNYIDTHPRINQSSMMHKIRKLVHSLLLYKAAIRTLVLCLTLSVLIQLIIALTCLLLASTMGFEANRLLDYAFASSVTQIINLIPVSPGGFGIGEIAFSKIMCILTGIKFASYATIFMTYRLLGLFIYLPSLPLLLLERTKLQATSNRAHPEL